MCITIDQARAVLHMRNVSCPDQQCPLRFFRFIRIQIRFFDERSRCRFGAHRGGRCGRRADHPLVGGSAPLHARAAAAVYTV